VRIMGGFDRPWVFATIFRRMDRRATAGSLYRRTTILGIPCGDWGGFDRPWVFATIFRRMDRRATAGSPYRRTTILGIPCGDWGGFDRPWVFATIFRRMDRRATAGSPYRRTTILGFLAAIVGAVFDRPWVFATIFRRMDRRATAGSPYRRTTILGFLAAIGAVSTARGCLLRYSGGWTGGRPQVAPTGVQRFWGFLAAIVGAVFDRPWVFASSRPGGPDPGAECVAHL
jgi:hypothetical protein